MTLLYTSWVTKWPINVVVSQDIDVQSCFYNGDVNILKYVIFVVFSVSRAKK